VSSTCHYRETSFFVTLRRVQRGVNVSDVLKAQLKARNWTQQELADRTGIARSDINAFCNGKSVGDQRLRRIATALRMSADDLRAAGAMEESDQPPPDIDLLLAQVEGAPDEPVAMVAIALRLLVRRLELVERQLTHVVVGAS